MRGSSSKQSAPSHICFLGMRHLGYRTQSWLVGELQILSPQEDVDKTVDDSVELSQLPRIPWLADSPLSGKSDLFDSI